MKLKLLIFTMLCVLTFSGAGSAQTRKTVTPNFVTELPATCNSNLPSQTVYIVKNDAQYICKNNVFEKLGAGNYKGAFAKSALPTAGVVAGDRAQVTDSTKGEWRYNGSTWVPTDAGRRINFLDFCNPATDTDCSPELQAAIDVLNGSTGGTIVFPAGYTFKCASQIYMPVYHSIIFEGSASQEENATTVNLEFTGGGSGYFFLMPASYGIEFRNMFIEYTNPAFTGWLIYFGVHSSDAQKNKFFGSIFKGTPSAQNAAGLINLQKAIVGSIRDCTFMYAKIGIKGISRMPPLPAPREAEIHYAFAYVWQIENNIFNMFPRGAIVNPDALWTIKGNTFEPDEAGKLVAITNDFPIPSDALTRAMTISGNYFGDNAYATEPIVKAQMGGGSITDNWFTSPWNAINIQLSNSYGASVKNNYFETIGSASSLNFVASAVDFATTDTITLSVEHNFQTADYITLGNNYNAAPAPLVFNTRYYVIPVSPFAFKLATTVANARTGVAIDLTDAGTNYQTIARPAQVVGIDLRGDVGTNYSVEISSNSGAAPQLIREAGSNQETTKFNNRSFGYLVEPASSNAVAFNGYGKPNGSPGIAGFPGVLVGTSGDFSERADGAAIRQSSGGTAHPYATLVIQGQTSGAGVGIDFLVNDTSTAFTIGATKTTAFRPFQIGTAGTAMTAVKSASASLNFGATAANSCEDLDITGFSDLVDGAVASVGVPFALMAVNTSFSAVVKSSTTVTVRRCNSGITAATDPAATTIRASVTQF